MLDCARNLCLHFAYSAAHVANTLLTGFCFSHLHFRPCSRSFCPKWQAVIHIFTHWWLWLPCKVPTSPPGAVLGFSILPKDTSTCRPGESDCLPVLAVFPAIQSVRHSAAAHIFTFIGFCKQEVQLEKHLLEPNSENTIILNCIVIPSSNNRNSLCNIRAAF